MKRRELLKRLKSLGKEYDVAFGFIRNGGDHDIYLLGRISIAMPRHRELSEVLARGILRDARRQLGEGT